jgi:hypothetical protein
MSLKPSKKDWSSGVSHRNNDLVFRDNNFNNALGTTSGANITFTTSDSPSNSYTLTDATNFKG